MNVEVVQRRLWEQSQQHRKLRESSTPLFPVSPYDGRVRSFMDLMDQPQWIAAACDRVLSRSRHRDTLESRMQGKLVRPVWGWGPGEIPGPTPQFVGSPRGGQRAAILYSLVSSAKAGGVEPFAWLRDVFTQLPYHRDGEAFRQAASGVPVTSDELDHLLPDKWLEANPGHIWTIDQIRREERVKKVGA